LGSVSVVPECLPLSVEYPEAPDAPESAPVAVGQDEDPLSSVGRSNVGRADTTPLRIEPELGQIGEDSGKSSSNKPRHVLQEDALGFHLANDPGDVEPQAGAGALPKPLALPGDRDVLAGESRSDEIHSSTPRCAIEGCEIVPDRRAIQGLVFHPRHENGRAEGVPLDVGHNTISDSSGDSEVEPADAAAEAKGS